MRSVAVRLRSVGSIVAMACAFAVALRLPFVGLPPYTDEGGLLVVARGWSTGGPRLYGRLFVDRPPLLLLFFRVSDLLGGITAVRVLALGLVVVLVAAAGRAGLLLGGRRGAVCAALVAAALMANPALGTKEVDGETVGAPLTVLGCALVVRAYAGLPLTPGRRRLMLAGAGAAAVCAVLVKQNLIDALAFGFVAVLASAHRGEWRRTWTDLGAFVTGALVPTVAAVTWALVATPGVGTLWFTLYRFRFDALLVIGSQSTAAPQARLGVMWDAALVSGLVLVLVSVWTLRRRMFMRDPLTWALIVMLAAEVTGVLGGGSYWTHYLIGLVPGAALLAARAAGAHARTWPVSLAVAVTVVSCLLHASGSAVSGGTSTGDAETGLAGWLSAASRPGDTGVVVYGAADLFATTPLRPAYPYLWTLPMRTLDPHLDGLVRRLDGGAAPTFVVERMPADSWGIDPRGRVGSALSRRYRPVGSVCGVPVFVHDGVARVLPPLPTRCSG